MTTATWSAYGQHQFINAYKNGESFIGLFDKLDRNSSTRAGLEAMQGAVNTAIMVVSAYRESGVKFNDIKELSIIDTDQGDLMLTMHRILSDRDNRSVVKYLGTMIAVLEYTREKSPVTFNFIKSDNTPQPMKIEITSMPIRSTTTTVGHDTDGNITGSIQLEQDA